MIFSMHDEKSKIAHLLRRAGFGPTGEELREALAKGFAATLRDLVDFESLPENLDDLEKELAGEILDPNDAGDLKAWWLCRMLRTRRPLLEKMVLFWHGHFATSNAKVGSGPYMQEQNDLFRRYAVGRFEDLLLAVSKDPAMLVYLDGNLNRKGAPNENYGREILELFTLGVGHYSEGDVRAAARAFTGWQIREGKFFFAARQHDESEKTFLGQTGNWNGQDIVRILASHPQTARFLATKLCRFFAGEEHDSRLVDLLIAEYRRTGGEIRAMLRKLFQSELFYDAGARAPRIKSPVELVVGAIRALDGRAPLRLVVRLIPRLGQDLFYPPNVKGWDGGSAWINSSTMVERLNLMKALATGVGVVASPLLDPEEWAGKEGWESAPAAIEGILDRFALEIPESSRKALLDYLITKPRGEGEAFPAKSAQDPKLRGLAHLVLCLPEFQWA